MTGMSLLKPDLIFIALGTIAVGNGLFKLTSQLAFEVLSAERSAA